MSFHILDKDIDITELERYALEGGILQIMPAKFYSRFTPSQLALFCHRYAFYTLPTLELIDWLKRQIEGKLAIEICGGNGVLAKALGVLCYDSRIQETTPVAAYYASIGQPTVEYGDNIIERDANTVVKKMKPDVVIGSWVTQRYNPSTCYGSIYGPDETEILRFCQKYIHLGNIGVHRKKDILGIEHKKYHLDFYYTRSMNSSENIVWVWGE